MASPLGSMEHPKSIFLCVYWEDNGFVTSKEKTFSQLPFWVVGFKAVKGCDVKLHGDKSKWD